MVEELEDLFLFFKKTVEKEKKTKFVELYLKDDGKAPDLKKLEKDLEEFRKDCILEETMYEPFLIFACSYLI